MSDPTRSGVSIPGTSTMCFCVFVALTFKGCPTAVKQRAPYLTAAHFPPWFDLYLTSRKSVALPSCFVYSAHSLLRYPMPSIASRRLNLTSLVVLGHNIPFAAEGSLYVLLVRVLHLVAPPCSSALFLEVGSRDRKYSIEETDVKRG